MTWFVLLIALVLFAVRDDDGKGEYVSCEEWPALRIGLNTYRCRCWPDKTIYTLGNRVDLLEACTRFGRR